MKTKAQIALAMKTLHAEADGLLAAPTVEGLARLDAIKAELDALEAEKLGLERMESLKAQIGTQKAWTDASAAPFPGATDTDNGVKLYPNGVKTYAMPAAARSRVEVFKTIEGRPNAAKAYAFGMWALASVAGNQKAIQYCRDNGIPVVKIMDDGATKAHNELVNGSGGFLVPEEFDSDLIDLREQYGVFRPNARQRVMHTDTKRIPRRKGGLTAYFVGDDDAATESTKNWDAVTLIAKKIICLAKISSELNEDSVIDLGEDLAREISYAFANKEDDCGFNGDGTSPYGGIVGVRTALKTVNATIANIKGLQVATGTGYGTDYSSMVLKDFSKVKAKLPKYARTRRTAWYCHQGFYDAVMESLKLAAGGNTEQMIGNASTEMRFLGYPVITSQIFPDTSAISQVACLFGDLSLAADMGDRRQTTLAMSEHAGFANDEIWIRGTERFDITVHDVGDTTKAGPIVGLITASS